MGAKGKYGAYLMEKCSHFCSHPKNGDKALKSLNVVISIGGRGREIDFYVFTPICGLSLLYMKNDYIELFQQLRTIKALTTLLTTLFQMKKGKE